MADCKAIESLIQHWTAFKPKAPGVQVHQADEFNLPRSPVTEGTLRAFLTARPETHRTTFHLALTPVPYVGDLRRADIYLLMLNPSMGGAADYGTNEDPSFLKILEKTMRQALDDVTHKCFALDPHFWWTSWFTYYESFLRDAVWRHANAKEISYATALAELSNRLAILELVPYYSAASSQITRTRVSNLESSKCALRAAEHIAKLASQDEATVIVRWGWDRWEISDSPHIIRPESIFGRKRVHDAIVKRLERDLRIPRPTEEKQA